MREHTIVNKFLEGNKFGPNSRDGMLFTHSFMRVLENIYLACKVWPDYSKSVISTGA